MGPSLPCSSHSERGTKVVTVQGPGGSGVRLVRKVDFDSVIKSFASRKAPKVPIF